jgi:flagellin-like hook-associated protein FlgL
MADIALSIGVRQSLAAIKSTTSAQQAQQLKLATGKRINSAVDNPVNFFQASGLSNRARDLSSLLDSIGQATKVIEAADKGIKALTKLIESAQGSARQALQSTTSTPRVAGNNSVAISGSTVLSDASAGGFAAGDTITVNGTTVLTVAAGDDISDLVDAINSDSTLNPPGSAAKVQASVNARGQLEVESLDGSALTISGSDSAKVSTLFGNASMGAIASTNATRRDLATQFNLLRGQIDQLAKDSGYNGINLLDNGALKVQFNESNTASVTVTGVRFDAEGLGVGGAANTWQSDKDINDSLSSLTTALSRLRNQSSAFGSNLSVVQTREDFTKSMIDTLETGSDLLVLADQNEEAAKLVTLNTRQQLASTALSLATQAEQSGLRLF